jgi:hypothetical protein
MPWGLNPASGFWLPGFWGWVRWFWSVGFALGLGGPYDALMLFPSGQGQF